MQIVQLQKKVGFVVVPNLAKNVNLGTGFIGQLIEKVCPKSGHFTPISSGTVAIVDKTQWDPVLTF